LKTNNNKEFAYQPASDIHQMTIQYVIDKLDNRGAMEVKLHATQSFKAISDSMKVFNETLENSSSNKLLMEI
jgi:Ni,Fe-hydrogenase maturation factor